jgi:Autophagocytosis associated protein, active-site domain
VRGRLDKECPRGVEIGRVISSPPKKFGDFVEWRRSRSSGLFLTCPLLPSPTGVGRHHMMAKDCSETDFDAEAFRGACLELVEAYRSAGTETRWTPTASFGNAQSNAKRSGYLSIQRDLSLSEGRKAMIEYHVVFSESWQAPVLYFSPIWDDSQEPLSLKEVHDFVVEGDSRDALQDVGILGGISHGVYSSLIWFNAPGPSPPRDTILLYTSMSDGRFTE